MWSLSTVLVCQWLTLLQANGSARMSAGSHCSGFDIHAAVFAVMALLFAVSG